MNDAAMRARYADRQSLEIRTYDWLLRAVRTPRILGYGFLDLELGDPLDAEEDSGFVDEEFLEVDFPF